MGRDGERVIPAPTLFAAPETIAAIERAPAVALLIGSYDGSGNYGDLMQLDGALSLLAPLGPELLPLPVLERSLLDSHGELRDHFANPPTHPVFYDPGEDRRDALLPVPAPARATFAACYLYGGGYLNPSWGDRKLAMLEAAEGLLAASEVERVSRLASGQQVDADWVAALSDQEAKRLRAFELLLGRDRASAETLAAFAPGATTGDGGDDAVGLLRQLPAEHLPGDEGRLLVNLHAVEHQWVTDRPGAVANFQADFAAQLGRLAGATVLAQPLVAYLDRQVDERPMIERLAAACAARGIEVAEPLVLRPAAIEAAAAQIGRAALTLSCSYHVTLTSLLLGVPAALLGDNAYYEQKATGLTGSFDLPPAFTLSSAGDPAADADAVAAVVLDPSAGPALRQRLALAAARARERRLVAEATLLGNIGAGATAVLGELGHRLTERSAEPAALLAQLARGSDEGGAPEVERTEEAAAVPPPADDGSRQMLDEVLSSRSWRLTAPLRRTQSLFSRRR